MSTKAAGGRSLAVICSTVALATERVSAAQQGQLQGLLASSVSLASIIAPLGFSGFHFVVQRQWPGAVWLAVAAVNLLAVPFVLLGAPRARTSV